MKMIKRLYTFSLVLLFVSLTANQPATLAASLNQKTVSGEVVSVDSDKKEVVIKDGAGSEVHITVNESTKFTRGDQTVTLADLKAGEKVTVEAEEAEGKLVAKSIAVATE